MSRRTTSSAARWRTRAGAVLAIGALLTTAGCGADRLVEEATERGVEELAEAEGNGSADVDLDLEDGEVSVSGDGGSFSMGGDLPESFPADRVPLIDGELLTAVEVDDASTRGWAVTIRSTDADAFEQARDRLLDAGFAPRADAPGATSGADAYVMLVADGYQVILAGAGDQGVVAYTVNALDGASGG